MWRGELSLIDVRRPKDIGPYHEVMDLPWTESMVAVRPLVSAIEDIAEAALAKLIGELRETKTSVKAVGVVGSPPRSLEKIGSPHIRAHAAEGVLYRAVLETAAKRARLSCRGFSDRDMAGPLRDAADVLKRLGREAGPPWRADERMAAAAALLMLPR